MQMRRRTAVIAGAAAVTVALVSACLYWFVYLGVPLYDEWYCKSGEVPVIFDDGGGACISKGGTVPRGGTVDPLGNRPFVCDDRRGWTVIHRVNDEDCLRDGLDMPAGWSKGNVRR